MSKGLVYCHICGMILDKEDNMQIVQRNFATKKEKLLFDLCPMCLETIKKMEIPKTSLKLKTKDNKRIWQECEIRDFIYSSDERLFKCLIKLYNYQTEDEKKTKETKYDNAVGFNKPDSYSLSEAAKKYQEKGIEAFTEDEINLLRIKIEKYISQLTVIANA